MSQPVPAAPLAATTPSGRIHGEDLIADLFESMHDLHFSRDAVEGGDFCLGLAMAKLPSLAGIVQLYDINHREFLVTNTRGEGTEKLLLRRFPETDPLLASAMRKRRAVVIGNATEGDAATNERYAAIGGARSLIIAPVMQAGRFLGAIELVNPIDGVPFTESDGNAVSYIAEQLAEFVAARGVVTDPERISARPHQH
jgi:GAF domain-containing protein